MSKAKPLTKREAMLLNALKRLKAAFEPEDETPIRFEQYEALDHARSVIHNIEQNSTKAVHP